MKGKKTGGRKAGTPNRVTASIKEALVEAFDQMGGVSALIAWGKKHPSEFYALIGRLIPREPITAPAVTSPVLLGGAERARRVAYLVAKATMLTEADERSRTQLLGSGVAEGN